MQQQDQASEHSANWLMVVILIAIVGYIMPWAINGNAGLNLGAHDLASWTTLHPEAQGTLLPSLLLRGQLVLIAWIFAVYTPRPLLGLRWWFHAIVIGILFLAALPPLDFIYALDDNNQQQQAIIAVALLLGGMTGLSTVLRRWRGIISVIIGGIGVVTTLYGGFESLRLMRTYGLPAVIGGGIVILAAGYGVVIALQVWRWVKTNRATA